MRFARLLSSALLSLGIPACITAQPAVPTPEPYTKLYLVSNGPYPLYGTYGEWVAARARAPGVPNAQVERQTIDAARIARAQSRFDPQSEAWLLKGCIFDVQSTRPDEQDTAYVWAYGRVVRCDEPVVDGVLEPQMGVRPNKLWIYDGRVGYFPMSLLDPYSGSAPAPRH